MIVLGHRGARIAGPEQNPAAAFTRCFDLGFGMQTDLRDRGGELVIAHDMAVADDLTLAAMLDILAGRDLPLAIRIRADGLAGLLATAMSRVPRWFTFDMSVPEMLVQLRLGLPVFTRASEHERAPACYDAASGVWLDAFEGIWFSANYVRTFLEDGKQVCIASPELHGRDREELWHVMRDWPFLDDPGLMLCTDYPTEAAAALR